MKDTPGEKPPGLLKKIIFGAINNTVTVVLRGELLKRISYGKSQPRSDGNQPNYRVERDPAITLFAVEDNIFPLSIDDYHLLTAIESRFNRFFVFSMSQWLEWGTNLKVNDHVYISLPIPNTSSIWSTGIVRYRGFVKTLPGIHFGVELTVSTVVSQKRDHGQCTLPWGVG